MAGLAREVNGNLGRYGTERLDTCPSGNGQDYGEYLVGMAVEGKFYRKIDKRCVSGVVGIFEDLCLTWTAERAVGGWWFKEGSFEDLVHRRPIFSQLCAQLEGMTPPLTIAQWTLPLVEEVLEAVGKDGKKTILFVDDEPMFAPEYAQRVEDFVKKHAAEFPANKWSPEAGTCDAYKLVKELNLFQGGIPHATIDTYRVTSLLPADDDEDDEEYVEEQARKQRKITFDEFNTVDACAPPANPRAKPAGAYKAAPPIKPPHSLSTEQAKVGRVGAASGKGTSSASSVNNGAAAVAGKGGKGGAKSAAGGAKSAAGGTGTSSTADKSDDSAAIFTPPGGPGPSSSAAVASTKGTGKSSRIDTDDRSKEGGPSKPQKDAPLPPAKKKRSGTDESLVAASQETRSTETKRDREKTVVRYPL